VKLLKKSIIRQENNENMLKILSYLSLSCSFYGHNVYFLLPCSVESSEIDLSEFQEENRDDGNGGGDGNDGNDGTGQDDAQPSNPSAEPASGDVGERIPPLLLI
jgi:hypothetical protein